jgi:small-conductance mechanosensitive channel
MLSPAIAILSVLPTDYITPDRLLQIIRVFLILLIGLPLVKIATHLTGKFTRNKLSTQSEVLIKRFVYYAGVIIILITVLNEFGFKLSALLGAAGILGIAIGFAAQTSISNIISGIFLMAEKPFQLGDSIQIGATVGSVLSIDLLSIKVKTPENCFVRIPNETMLKTEVINITRFPLRRLNLALTVSCKDDLDRVTNILKAIAQQEPLALKQPEPVVQIEQYAPPCIKIIFGVWGTQENIGELKNALLLAVQKRFEQDSIGLPYTYPAVSGKSEEQSKL